MLVCTSLWKTRRLREHCAMAPRRHPELTASELRLLPLLTTPLSFGEISRLLDVPRHEIQATAISTYHKLGVWRQRTDERTLRAVAPDG
jgi:hypothetical protein